MCLFIRAAPPVAEFFGHPADTPIFVGGGDDASAETVRIADQGRCVREIREWPVRVFRWNKRPHLMWPTNPCGAFDGSLDAVNGWARVGVAQHHHIGVRLPYRVVACGTEVEYFVAPVCSDDGDVREVLLPIAANALVRLESARAGPPRDGYCEWRLHGLQSIRLVQRLPVRSGRKPVIL